MVKKIGIFFTIIYVLTLTFFTHTICHTDLYSWCDELRMNKAIGTNWGIQCWRNGECTICPMRKRERDVTVKTITHFVSSNCCLSCSHSHSVWICAFVFVQAYIWELSGTVLLLLVCFVSMLKAICMAPIDFNLWDEIKSQLNLIAFFRLFVHYNSLLSIGYNFLSAYRRFFFVDRTNIRVSFHTDTQNHIL